MDQIEKKKKKKEKRAKRQLWTIICQAQSGKDCYWKLNPMELETITTRGPDGAIAKAAQTP